MNASTTIQQSDMRLGVNVDHVATLRQARGTSYPSVADAARQAMAAGADSITIHLREDRRHIQDADVEILCAAGDVPVNLEMALTDEMVDIALRHKPRDCCLVPESREELTTEGGLDVAGQIERVRDGLDRLQGAGINAALFIDPEPDQIEAAAQAGARFIEIHTGAYADARDGGRGRARTRAHRDGRGTGREARYRSACRARSARRQRRAESPTSGPIVELNIGHALIARAVFVGLSEAVREMRAAIETAGAAIVH